MNKYNLIKSMYDRLENMGGRKSWNNPVKDMYRDNLQEEKSYRGTRGTDNPKFGATVAAKYFVVKHILEGLTSNLNVNDILSIRLSCYHGQAVANEYRAEIVAMFTADEIATFNSLQYDQLMRE